jgi:hypothetical protein
MSKAFSILTSRTRSINGGGLPFDYESAKKGVPGILYRAINRKG